MAVGGGLTHTHTHTTHGTFMSSGNRERTSMEISINSDIFTCLVGGYVAQIHQCSGNTAGSNIYERISHLLLYTTVLPLMQCTIINNNTDTKTSIQLFK